MKRTPRLALSATVMFALFFLLGSSNLSAQFLVDNLDDTHDMVPGDGSCDINSPPVNVGDCTLRAAVEEANELAGDDAITFAIPGTVLLVNGLLLVTESLTFTGQSAQSTIIQQDSESLGSFGIIWGGTGADEPEKITIENMTLREADRSAVETGANTVLTIEDCEFHENQVALNMGGAISTQGTVVIDRTIFSKNSAPSAGAIYMATNTANVTIRNSEFHDNESPGAGGAIRMDSSTGALVVQDSIFDNNRSTGSFGGAITAQGNVEILRSLFNDNHAGNDGGAIRYLQNSGSSDLLFEMMQSTVTNNTSTEEGGGMFILSNSDVTIVRSAFAGNEASIDGGGIAWGSLGGTHVIGNSTISGNTAPTGGGLDLAGAVQMIHITVYANNGGGIDNSSATASLRNSIVAHTDSLGSGADCVGAALDAADPNLDSDSTCGASITDTTPGVGGLPPALGHPLLPGSPALDAADMTVCLAAPILGIDQFGATRPLGPECDLGAYEGTEIPSFEDGFEKET